MSALPPVVLTLGGQAVWAIAQAATIIILSNLSLHAIIGLFTLGLAVFAPICLIGSFNLRTSIAIDRDRGISPVHAVLLRAVVIVFGLLITSALLYYASNSVYYWAIAIALVAVRAADQLSDVAIGFYQRDGKNHAIARSFVMRGLGGVLPFVAIIGMGGDIFFAALAALLITIAVAIVFDVAPLFAGNSYVLSVRTMFKEVVVMLRQTVWVAPYPVLDNLHFNSFRYAMFLGTSAEFVGIVGVAQTLFVPFQLAASAMGFEFLPEARRIAANGSAAAFRAHALWGMALGLAVTVAFLLCSLVAPNWALSLLFADRAAVAGSVVELTAFSMLPSIATGFAGLSLIARGRQVEYLAGPIIGLCSFLAIAAAILVVCRPQPELVVAIAFFVSCSLRLAFAQAIAISPLTSISQPQASR